ncbi:uncharacterized protein N7511_001574 [Penicillium nucicola]|uniref:uncharacterized protein n=1 Tax=Penicillium nucicola TaxID=1850975 RepID=UPI0025454DFF|nr:uncharacterized protein N7511_001574 [Penicillium nucicola]KAJ5776563.1 hypothetical protein N7511_001574 [Penicillium nucicola]
MPKRTKPRSTEVSLDYLNTVNAKSKRRRTIHDEPRLGIYDLPTSPARPHETRTAGRVPTSEPATRFRALRNRQIAVQSKATPRSSSNEEQQSSNDAQAESDNNQSSEPESIDQATESQQTRVDVEIIRENEASDGGERQPPPHASVHSSINDLFVPMEDGYQPESSGFVSINDPRRVSSGKSRPRPRASDLFPARSPEITEAQSEQDENSSPASIDAHSNGVHSDIDSNDEESDYQKQNRIDSDESDTSEEIIKGHGIDKISVADAQDDNPLFYPIHLFSDDAEPEPEAEPDVYSSTESLNPIPAIHPDKQSADEVQVSAQTKDFRKPTPRNPLHRTESRPVQNQSQSQTPETPSQPRRDLRDRTSRKEDAADCPTTSLTENKSSNRRSTLDVVEDHEVRVGIFSWLEYNVKESGFKDHWKLICRPRGVLKHRADVSLEERFTGTGKLIQRLRDLYKAMAQEPHSTHYPIDRCRLIANSILNEGQSIIVEEAPAYEHDDLGGHLVNQFEAHVVPDLIKLLVAAFRTYKSAGDGAKPHLRIALDLVWATCHRICTTKDLDDLLGPYIWATSRDIMKSLKAIKDALNDGRLLERHSNAYQIPVKYKHFELTEVQSMITCDPWTRAEKLALLEGINGLTHDIDTFVDLKCNMVYGAALERRTLKDLQTKAQQLGL